jgi:ABC-2 type transport system ATP-binding protein
MAESVAQEAIEVRNLVREFRKRGDPPVVAVNDVSFSVSPGEIFGLLGPNGAGKSTTIRVLTTLLAPTSGEARILGHDVVRDALEVRRRIVAVLQENAVEIFLSVKDNFRTFGRFHGLSAREIETRSERVIELFGLGEFRAQKPIDLSGGLKRRVQVAKVFMVDKPVVFLDEATTGMDTMNKRATMNAIREEAGRGRTIVLTTHVMDEAEELCGRVLIINHGRVVASGTPEEVKALSLRLFTLTFTVDDVSPALLEAVASQRPLETTVRGATIEVTLRDEAAALAILARAGAVSPVRHFEMTGSTLEDAFLHLLDEERTQP